MALTHTRDLEVATEAKAVAKVLKAADKRVRAFIATNSHLSIDWGGAQKPAHLNEDAVGNIDGVAFTRTQLSNAIGTFAAFITLMDAGHLGNLSHLADVEID
jgi:hypothetical protein